MLLLIYPLLFPRGPGTTVSPTPRRWITLLADLRFPTVVVDLRYFVVPVVTRLRYVYG